jgi:hypothetical protein
MMTQETKQTSKRKRSHGIIYDETVHTVSQAGHLQLPRVLIWVSVGLWMRSSAA